MRCIYCTLFDNINDWNAYGLLTKQWNKWLLYESSESFTKILLHFNTSTWEECTKVGHIQICNVTYYGPAPILSR